MVNAANIRGMVEIGYAATTIGEFDLFMGARYLKERIQGSGLNVVSANVYDESTGGLFVEPYVIVERAGVRFGITGVTDQHMDVRPHGSVESLGVAFADPREKLEELVPELREKVDFVVVLSYMGVSLSRELAENVAGIDFVVVGNQRAKSSEPFEAGGAVFVQPGSKGQNIADYRLSFDEDHVYQGFEGSVAVLDPNVPADAAMALMLKEHNHAVDKIRKERAAQRAREREAQQKGLSGYREACLGVNASCAKCHGGQYDQWKETPHAHAFESLEKSLQSTNPACIRCHTTCFVDLPQGSSEPVNDELRGVQCESCHGMGTEHARDGSYGAVKVETCLACHDKERSPDFDLATYLPKVRH